MQQLSQSVSNDLLTFNKLLKRHNNDIENVLSSLPITNNIKDLECSTCEQDITINSFTQCRTDLALPSNEPLKTEHHDSSSVNRILFESPLEEGTFMTMPNSYNSIDENNPQNLQDTKIITDTSATNHRVGSHSKICTENISGNSSPNSNFSCTPIESVSSCTPEGTLANELNEVYDPIPSITSSKHCTLLDTINSHQTQNDTKYQMNSVEVDAAEKFFLEQFSIDGDFERMNISPSIPSANNKQISRKRSPIRNISKNSKKRKVIEELTLDESSLRKCFSKLKSTYLLLCQTHNCLIDDYNKTKHQNKELRRALDDVITDKETLENEKDYYLLEREDMKAAIESLLHEVQLYRSKSEVNSKCIC